MFTSILLQTSHYCNLIAFKNGKYSLHDNRWWIKGGGVCTKKIQICEASQSDLEKSMVLTL